MEHTAIKYKIRPHHGLCMTFFEGKGYNEEFTKHMASVIDMMKDQDLVQLVCEVDIVCEKCPNNNNFVCTTHEKVTQYDNSVLKHCNLKHNDVIAFGDFKRLLKQRILSFDKLDTICKNCEWIAICQAKCKDKRY